jgi:hypothetical protein
MYACRIMSTYTRIYSIGKLHDLFVRLNFVRDIHSEYFNSILLGLFQEYSNKTQSFLCTLSSKLIIDMLIGGMCCVLLAYYCNTS